MGVATMANINVLFVTLDVCDSKHTEASFSPNSTDLLLLQLAQMPRSPDLAVFVSTTMATTTTEPTTLPLRMRTG